MQQYTYILINFFTVIICFIFSFHPKIKFNKHFRSFFLASLIVAVPFIIWDSWFTQKGVWWFNENYTLGLNFAGLPIEEILFFICIPFSCVFTYYCLNKFFNLNVFNKYNSPIALLTLIICLLVSFFYYDKIYPLITAIFTLLTTIYLQWIVRVSWIAKASFVYTVLMLGFFPVNGILTGTGLDSPIVNYNPAHFLNFRMGTIPVEDAVYGYTLFLLNLYFFHLINNKRKEFIKPEKEKELVYPVNER